MAAKTWLGKLNINLTEERDDAVITEADQRLLLVIKARWFLIGLLILYGVLSSLAYIYAGYTKSDPSALKNALEVMLYPGIIIFLVAIYNGFYHYSWYKIPKVWNRNVKQLIFTQLAADIPVVLLLIHFTGGINSWFWTLFLVINLELTYLLTVNWQILFIGALAGVSYSILSILEHKGIIASYHVPYFPSFHDSTYLILTLFWVNLICGFACLVSIYLHRSEHRELKERIVRDGLTNLYNRRYFNHRFNSELKRAQRYSRTLSVILLDLDNFKEYNDTYGHMEGDNLLKWVAGIIKLNIRQSNEEPIYDIDVACRFGGEEFAIILPETTTNFNQRTAINGAITIAERIRSSIVAAKWATGKGITISAGVACYPLDGQTEEEILEAADKALYLAKKEGKNKVLAASKNLTATTAS